jgi:hypothetical protein
MAVWRANGLCNRQCMRADPKKTLGSDGGNSSITGPHSLRVCVEWAAELIAKGGRYKGVLAMEIARLGTSRRARGG